MTAVKRGGEEGRGAAVQSCDSGATMSAETQTSSSPTSSRYRRPTVVRSSPTVSTRQAMLTLAVSRQKENSVPPEQLMST
ncbi:uncharacterized protein V6R79_006781 [Siganus canaliculatus]